jgi:hypothetical protein
MTAPATDRSAPVPARQRNFTLPISAAQPGSQGRPTTPEPNASAHAALDGPAKRSYMPTNPRPAAAVRWVERVARSIPGSTVQR